MKISIQNKLFFAMLAATLAIVGLMAIVIQWSFDRGFLEYVNVEERGEISKLALQLEDFYAKNKSWEILAKDPAEVLRLHALILPEEKLKHRDHDRPHHDKPPEWIVHPDKKGEAEFRRHPIERTVILDENGALFFGEKLGNKLPWLMPLMYEDKQVGSIGLYPPQKLLEANQLMFLERQKIVISSICVAAIVITILTSMTIAYHLTKPIRKLSAAAQKLIEGDYTTRVTADSKIGRASCRERVS
jgi:two-component system sensor histidine kinase BaeS